MLIECGAVQFIPTASIAGSWCDCLSPLFTDEQFKTETARQGKVLEQSQDGFFHPEMDMRFRGPGEVLGSRQSQPEP